MAQYDIILAQNVAATGLEFSEKYVAIATNKLVIGDANALPSSFNNGTAKQYLRTNAAGTAPEWKSLSGTPETSFTLNEDGSTSKMKFETGLTGNFTLTLSNPASLTGNRTQTFQDKDGTIALKSDISDAFAANDAMVYKGVINCSANPNYPAADAGHTYKISAAGKLGGVSGKAVEIGDMAICTTDGSVSGDQATVGANWNIIQMNIDGYVIGPASATNDRIAVFDGVTGKLIKDGGTTVAGLKNTLLDGNNHTDTASGTVARGSLIVGNATPKWSALTIGAAGTVLKSNGTDVSWGTEYSYTHPTVSSLTNAADASTTLTGIKLVGGDNPFTLSGNHITGFEYRTLVAGSNVSLTAAADGTITIDGTYAYNEWVNAPATSTSTGTAGQKAYDNTQGFLYICTAKDTWRRVPLAKNW